MVHVLMSSSSTYCMLGTAGKWGHMLPNSWGVLESEGLDQCQLGGGWSVVGVGWSSLGAMVGGVGLLAQTNSRPGVLTHGFYPLSHLRGHRGLLGVLVSDPGGWGC